MISTERLDDAAIGYTHGVSALKYQSLKPRETSHAVTDDPLASTTLLIVHVHGSICLYVQQAVAECK